MKKIIFCFLFFVPIKISSMDFFAGRNYLAPFDTKEYFFQTGEIIDKQNLKNQSLEPVKKNPLSLKTLATRKIANLLQTSKKKDQNRLKILVKDLPLELQFLILEELERQCSNPSMLDEIKTKTEKFLSIALWLFSKNVANKTDYYIFFQKHIEPLLVK